MTIDRPKSEICKIVALCTIVFGLLLGCEKSSVKNSGAEVATNPSAQVSDEVRIEPPRRKVSKSAIVSAARGQVGKTTVYDPAYVGLKYPGGDVSVERGVCTDVVIRSLRDAHSIDLQKQVHEDMSVAFSKYPTIWGLKKTDRNIDHRRVPNLGRYFIRKGYSVGISQESGDYLPGDLVTCTVGGNRPHIMIVSDKVSDGGVPLVIHNIGSGTQEEDLLFEFQITGHFRIPVDSSIE